MGNFEIWKGEIDTGCNVVLCELIEGATAKRLNIYN